VLGTRQVFWNLTGFGQQLPVEHSAFQSFKRQLRSESCLSTKASNSAKAAGGDLDEKWPILITDRPLPFWDGECLLLHMGYVGSVPKAVL